MRGTALILLILLAGCDKPASQPAQSTPDAPKTLPADQQAFLAIPRNGEAADDFCTKFKTYNGFENWQGNLHSLSVSSLDGSADMELTIGQSIRLEALVRKDDPNYAKVIALTYGQAVTVSGQILHTNNDSECLYYRGPFGFRLSAISPGG